MRYADGPEAHVERRVQAPPSRLWPLVTDIALPTRFSPELRHAEWSDGATGPALGATFIGHNRNSILGEWQTISRVVELVPERVFGWAVVGDPADETPAATWRFELEPDGDATLLRQIARLGPGPSGLSLAIDRWPEKEEAIVARRVDDLRTAMRATVDGIKALAEG